MNSNLAEACTHEAGHAVAAVLAPYTVLRCSWVTRDGHGRTEFSGGTGGAAFIAFAGPWAQARCEWEADVTETPMATHLAKAIEWQPQDAAQFLDDVHDCGEGWDNILTEYWPAIRKVADLLRQYGEVDHDTVAAAINTQEGIVTAA